MFGSGSERLEVLRLDAADVDLLAGLEAVEARRRGARVRAHVLKVQPVADLELREEDGPRDDVDAVAGVPEHRARVQALAAVGAGTGAGAEDAGSAARVVEHEVVEAPVHAFVDVVRCHVEKRVEMSQKGKKKSSKQLGNVTQKMRRFNCTRTVVVLEGARVGDGLHDETADGGFAGGGQGDDSRRPFLFAAGGVVVAAVAFGARLAICRGRNERVVHALHGVVGALPLLDVGRAEQVGRRVVALPVQVERVVVHVDLLLGDLLAGVQLGVVLELVADRLHDQVVRDRVDQAASADAEPPRVATKAAAASRGVGAGVTSSTTAAAIATLADHAPVGALLLEAVANLPVVDVPGDYRLRLRMLHRADMTEQHSVAAAATKYRPGSAMTLTFDSGGNSSSMIGATCSAISLKNMNRCCPSPSAAAASSFSSSLSSPSLLLRSDGGGVACLPTSGSSSSSSPLSSTTAGVPKAWRK